MKKKWYYKPGLSWERRKKFLLVFLLNVFLFFGVQAQTHRVTLNVKETSLEQVIKELEKQTGLQFFYSQDKIEKITGLSLQAKQEDFKTILDRLLKHTPLTFTVMDNVVVIKDREKNGFTASVGYSGDKRSGDGCAGKHLAGGDCPDQRDDLGRDNRYRRCLSAQSS